MKVSKTFLVHGVPQWLYIQLAEKPRGTLFFLHGGPGWSDAPWAHLTCKLLWQDFNIVHWDQPGTNRSFYSELTTPPLTLNQVMTDAVEVVRILENEFGIKKPILVGHSWGSMLGVLLAQKAPELFHSFIGVGQLVSNQQSEKLSLNFCKEAAERLKMPKIVAELNTLNDDFYTDLDLLFRQREILFELGGEFVSQVSLEDLTSWMNKAPLDYQSSWEKMYSSCTFSMNKLWNEVIGRDLFLECPSLEIPVTLLQGRHDYCTASTLAIQWFEQLSAPSKQFIWFENSAHWPQLEENGKWSRFFLDSF